MDHKRVIIIEDDLEICNLLEIHLNDLNFDVSSYQDGALGLNAVFDNPPDLIILDIRLPTMDGIEICQKVRAQNILSSIIMLTARSEEIDKVLGLEVGADDYMTKPFSIREFIARVKAIFRRSKMLNENANDANQNLLQFESLSIDIEKRKVLLNEKKIDLSPKEFELLVLMASNPGKNYKRGQLLSLIWGYDFAGYEHTVNSHINRLRTKIEQDMDNPKFILTTWGVGYKFNEDLN
jgi:two-component system, OmpR family, alkaline phosphatase synthesis response regulator PhoP